MSPIKVGSGWNGGASGIDGGGGVEGVDPFVASDGFDFSIERSLPTSQTRVPAAVSATARVSTTTATLRHRAFHSSVAFIC